MIKHEQFNYLSVCSGIEAATVAWDHLGWSPVAFSEIEKFPSQVLKHHYPLIPNLGDMTQFKEWHFDRTVNLLVGGTPCQSFSLAGLRKGMEDPRGNLALTYLAILDKFRPKWCVWENVPGVLSSGKGRDFGAFLGGLVELGYGFAYRVLDAQNFGVAQRRRRVFVVGCSSGWELAAKVLFEPESLRGNIKTGRKTRETVAGYVESSFGQYRKDVIAGTLKASGGVLSGGSETFVTNSTVGTLLARDYKGVDSYNTDKMIVQAVYETHPSDSRVKEMGKTCQTVTSRWGTGGGNIPFVQTMEAVAQPILLEDQGGSIINTTQTGIVGTLRRESHGHEPCVIAFEPGIAKREGSLSRFSEELSPTLRAVMGDNQVAMASTMGVRRLTPIECERLQGFPDGYTDIQLNGKQTPDGSRYKSLGNSMAVPVMRWIGERIQMAGNSQ